MTKKFPHGDFLHIAVEKPVFFTVIVYLILIFIMEVIGYSVGVIYGSLGNALLVFVAINHSVWARKTPLQSILPALALIPFLRLLSVVLPVPGWPPQIVYVLVAVPMLFTIGMIMHSYDISLVTLGLRNSSWRSQLLIATSGVPLGLFGFFILRPAPLFKISNPFVLGISLLVILLFISFLEEIIFRGVFLQAVVQVNENFAVLSSSMLYGIYHIGSQSLGYTLFMGFVGLLFAYFVIRSRSLWGVVIANFFLTVGMGMLWPFIFK